MALTDIFTGDPQKEAAAKQQAAIALAQQQTKDAIATAQNAGLGTLQSGQYTGTNAINAGTAAGSSAIDAGTAAANAALTSGQTMGAGAITNSTNQGLGALQSGAVAARGDYAPLTGLAGDFTGRTDLAGNMSENALGLNGQAGIDTATNAFRSAPGYNFAVDRGLDAITRVANAGGQVAGGNVLRESQKFGQGLADQDWQQWLANLSGREGIYAPLAANTTGAAASGLAGIDTGQGRDAATLLAGSGGKLSDLYSGTGGKLADVATGGAKTLADLASTGGLAVGSLAGNTGAQSANLIQNLTGAGINFNSGALGKQTQSYMDAANAETGGSANLWNLIGGGAKLAGGLGYLPTGGYSPTKLF